MGKSSKIDEKLSPITFKLPVGMEEKMEELVKKGIYANRAELIREAIQDLITFSPEAESSKQK